MTVISRSECYVTYLAAASRLNEALVAGDLVQVGKASEAVEDCFNDLIAEVIWDALNAGSYGRRLR
jgi:hypothetical protein